MNKNIVRDQNLSTEEQALPREIELTDTALEAIYGGKGGDLLDGVAANLFTQKKDTVGEGLGDVLQGL